MCEAALICSLFVVCVRGQTKGGKRARDKREKGGKGEGLAYGDQESRAGVSQFCRGDEVVFGVAREWELCECVDALSTIFKYDQQ